MPEFMKKFPVPTRNKGGWMQNSDSVFNKFVENLLHVRRHFIKVGQHVQHDMVPLFMIQGLGGRCTCASELPSEKVEVRFIFAYIVMRGQIMHAREVVTIVCCCEVRHLLQNVCLCNGSLDFAFISIFLSKNLQTSLDWIAPTALHGPPPFVPHTGGAKSSAASD